MVLKCTAAWALLLIYRRPFQMNPLQMKHRRRLPVLAAALLVAATSVALAEPEAAPTQQRSSFWSWLTSSPAPAAKPKPAAPAPARVAGQAEPAKANCSSFFSCITLVGIGF
jgi:hypothetical protein